MSIFGSRMMGLKKFGISISFTPAAAARLAGLAGAARIWSGWFGLGFLGACYVIFRTQHPRRLIAEPDWSQFSLIVLLLGLGLQHFMFVRRSPVAKKFLMFDAFGTRFFSSKKTKAKTDWLGETWIRTTALQVPFWSLLISWTSARMFIHIQWDRAKHCWLKAICWNCFESWLLLTTCQSIFSNS